MKFKLASFDPTALSSRTGLKFIPFYSPALPYKSGVTTEVHENDCTSAHLQHGDSPSTSPVTNTSGFIQELNFSQLTDSSNHHSDDSESEDDVLMGQVNRECTQEFQQATVLSKCLSHHQPTMKMPFK